MTAPIYYINDDNTPLNDAGWKTLLQSLLSQAVASIVPGGKITIDFAVGVLTSAQFQVISDVGFNIESMPDTSEIKMGDELYPADVFIDASITTAATLAILSIAGITNPISIAALAVVGGINVGYSKFVDPINEDILSTLAGKDMIQYFDENGDEVSGLVFPDGYPGTKHDAIKAFIAYEQSANYDLTKGHIQVDDDIALDERFVIKEASIFQTMADRLNVTLSEFLSFSSGAYNNDEFYVLNHNGDAFIFYSDDGNTLYPSESDHSKLALPVMVGGILPQNRHITHSNYLIN